MRVSTLFALLFLGAGANGFVSQSLSSERSSLVVSYGYIPDGFTAEDWKKFKQEEAAKNKKNLGKLGPRGFQSRSFQSFQEALERGEADHLMPVFNAQDKIKSGKIRPEDVPYMQRGGKWDNTDIRNARNIKKWLPSDKQYKEGGYKKEQSFSIFGYGEGLDWTGSQSRKGPTQSESILAAAPKFGKNYKPPNINTMKGAKKNDGEEPPKKKLFGLF